MNNSIEHRMANLDPADLAGLQKILQDKKKMESMPRLPL